MEEIATEDLVGFKQAKTPLMPLSILNQLTLLQNKKKLENLSWEIEGKAVYIIINKNYSCWRRNF